MPLHRLMLRFHTGIFVRRVLLIWVLFLADPVSGELLDYSTYRVLNTEFARIFFSEDHVITRFNRVLELGRVEQLVNWGSLQSSDAGQVVTAKIDALFRRVEEILDMRPAGLRTTMIIATDSREFRSIYQRMYHTETNLIAFYSPARNVIVIDPTTVTANVLAHEMAHAVIHAYYGNANTPSKIHEILAQYVDIHLED